VVKTLPTSSDHFPALARTGYSDVYDLGMTLFSGFNLPFQIIGVLLLVATVGVVILSRRSLR
jgi:NADH-quinone oxidoreductase subunit J